MLSQEVAIPESTTSIRHCHPYARKHVVCTMYGTHEAVTEYARCCLRKWVYQKIQQVFRHCHPYARKPASEAVLDRMQLSLHADRRTPLAASCLVQEKFAWSVKTRRPPSRHSTDAKVYGNATTAMHGLLCCHTTVLRPCIAPLCPLTFRLRL